MPERRPGQVASRRIYEGRVVTLDVDRVAMPDGRDVELEMVRHRGAAAVVPLLSAPDSTDPSVLLLNQYRYAAEGTLWEIPAGTLEPEEDPLTCARRELREETGARAETVEQLTTIYTTPGFTDERIHLFLATGITAGEPDHQRDEFIQVEARPMSRVLTMIRDGELVDAKSIVALLYVAGYRMNV